MDTHYITDKFGEIRKEKSLESKIKKFIELILKSQTSIYIIASSVIVTFSSLFSNVFSYLFQLFAGNYLTKDDFAELTSLFALSGIIALLVSFLSNGIAKLVAEINDKASNQRISMFFYSLLKINIFLTITVTAAIFLLSNNIGNFLNIKDNSVVYIFTIAVGASIINSTFGPFLQGLQKFKSHSAFTFLTSLTKFSVIIIVMYFSLQLKDIFWGLAITTLIMSLVGFFMLMSSISHNLRFFSGNDIKTLFSYSIGGLWTILGLNLLQNVDIIMVKHYFSAETSGLYSGISIIGKIIFYVASPITLVMLPICSEYYKNKKNIFRPFIISLTLTILAASTTYIIFAMFPEFVIKTLFGQKYIQAAPNLPLYSLFMLLYSIVTLLGFFSISISRFRLGAVSLVGAILQYLFLLFFHNSIGTIIGINIISISVVLVLYVLLLLRTKHA